MILKQLTIHHIASIEDAEIDFDKGVLGEESIFLICGETGAGKTTILDCICLALYNNTPRMESSRRESYQDEQAKNNSSVKDCSQLMRRNTAEASVKLRFRGSNEINYTAEWSVRRARQKVDGALQPIVWTLWNEDENIHFSKANDIKQEIDWAVGLSFEQYCRTAMLAQGEFTRFLKSDDKEKSEILEKLTGTEIYSEIGKNIFLTDKENADKLKQQKDRLNVYELMSDEELTACKEHIVELSENNSKKELERADVNKKLVWLNKEKDLQNLLTEKERIRKEKIELLASQSVKLREQLLADWNLTTDARAWKKSLETLKEEQQNNKRGEESCLTDFNGLEEGRNELRKQVDVLRQRQKTVGEALKRFEPDEQMLDNSQSILTELNVFLVAEKQKKNEGTKKAELEGNVQMLSEKLNRAVQACEAAMKSKNDKQQEIDGQNEVLKKMDQTRLEGNRDEIQKQLENLAAALRNLKDSEAKRAALVTAQNNLAANSKLLSQYDEEKCSLQKEVERRTAVYEKEKCQYEKMEKSVSDYVKELRAELGAGDLCPVCGRKIEKLDDDEHFQSALEPLRSSMKKAEDEMKQTKDELHQTEAKIMSLSLLTNQNKVTVADDLKLSETADKEALDACRKCGIEQLSDSVAEQLKQKQEEATVRLNSVTVQLEKARNLTQKISELQLEKDGLQKDLEGVQNKLTTVRDEVKRNQSSIEEKEALIKTHGVQMENALKELSDKMTWQDWRKDLQREGEVFVDKVKKTSKEYDDLKTERTHIGEELGKIENEASHAAVLHQNILMLFPNWETHQSMGVSHVDNLNEKLTKLNTNAAKLSEKIKSNEESRNRLQSQLDDFLSEHKEISAERFKELISHSADEMENEGKQLQKLRDDKSAAETAYTETRQQYEQLQREKPDLSPEDTPEQLADKEKILAESIKKNDQDIGSEKQKLADNETRLNTVKKEKAELEALQTAYDRWHNLSSIFGDAQGAHFRSIAQSYVLRTLLVNANCYLKYLSKRYRLECQPGSLTILFRDDYQGSVLRPVTTLSGGESFLISLSLALGLSSLNRQGLSIDTLFIDEGFGTLSTEYLNVVMDTLEKLHQLGGKRVGIISHVDSLRERIKTQIQIIKNGQSSSKVIVARVK